MTETKVIPAAAITIFGAKGDLTRRKLIPALYNLFIDNHLPSRFVIYCVDFLPMDEEVFKADLLDGINQFSRNGKADPVIWETFAQRIFYVQGDFLQAGTFTGLKEKLTAFDKANEQPGVRLFYFAVAPRFIEIISEALHKHKLCNKIALHRMIIEKPFGTDLTTARKLNRFLQERFDEKQVYRIDHYLGKETVQNIMAFRFANYVFEPLWNNKYIDHIQISVAEEVGVGKRGGYYDSSGALRDMIQNHLLQLLCVIAMECPAAYEAETIRDAKTRVLKSIRPYTNANVFKQVIRGQYTEGTVNNMPRPAYRNEEQVAADSNTETFVAAKLNIDNERWKGVPFFLRTGKSMPRQSSVIVIQFKDSPNKIFKDDIVPNRLIISIQPELEISLLFESKVPGLEMKLKPVEMDFMYQDAYSETLPEAYEALLIDALHGDATLFMRADQIEAAWKVVMPILDAWEKHRGKKLEFYPAGTWGPDACNSLLRPHATEWFSLPPHKGNGTHIPHP
ncbi:glucose-6-phosphate dehydrogenase [Pseudobacter ginsenosidimutans]|uniref:Glucose-6-phosphate 1-dehydrogenase n=1 Tax=Pseudobacter ginsenosidimutans TaxID=661488 RepID=A0A4Q7N135_9BACT|nr:glucose-6-phosphate dehydrogenase [Pseudobacter ginsenosidimutans]QEC43889.1 glucose-6-phosphate dehydrogenase [Pseudobacter ginsenosidimutans]RZS75317.1 glucose-6-phosphate 1-dehydrogenase [Pseudobacter ginsenosidimutans]